MLYSNYISLKQGKNKQVSREASHRKAFRQRSEGGTKEHHLDSGEAVPFRGRGKGKFPKEGVCQAHQGSREAGLAGQGAGGVTGVRASGKSGGFYKDTGFSSERDGSHCRL